jgi:c-di-GMP-binding flagellar brake protein YcgR
MAQGQGEIDEEQASSSSQGRRQEVRQQYKANASISRAGTASQYQAAVIDLSSGGCLIRLLKKGDFEVDDLVDLSVQSSDISFRARGDVRQVREDGTVLGIRLQSLTARGKALIRELIQELESGLLTST